MRVGILGTGALARSLGRVWSGAGHSVRITGRDPKHAAAAAEQIGLGAGVVDPARFASQVDVVVVAVAWDGLREALALVGADQGTLAGKTVIDCTNAVDYATGELKPGSASAAELVAGTAVGAHAVKALHLFAGTSWPYAGPQDRAPVVVICGDAPDAVEQASALIRDLGGRPALIAGLAGAGQAEEAAGFVMRVVAAGHNPRFAVPDVDPAPSGTAATGG
ncbi:NADPH-dependent F420 reductase [Plantactinospora siamensis]|uniref:NADPH-dependent F420 reductase n=1 Tax=Plantactinospora siamensis TaxID=555372 RepID=A0ABV6P370_9ACTN